MVTTKVLSDKDADAHKIAAYTAVVSYATAMIVFKFNEKTLISFYRTSLIT